MKARFSLLFALYCSLSIAQPQALQTGLKDLYIAFNDIDIDALSTMICSGKEHTAAYDALDAYFLNEETKFRYVLHNIKYNFGPQKIIGNQSFYPITFRNYVRITYFKPLINVEETQKSLKTKFGAESVLYEKARNSFLVIYNAKLVAFAETESTVWKYFLPMKRCLVQFRKGVCQMKSGQI